MQKDLNSLKQQDNWAASYPTLYNFVVFQNKTMYKLFKQTERRKLSVTKVDHFKTEI